MKSGTSDIVKAALRGFLTVTLLVGVACGTAAPATPSPASQTSPTKIPASTEASNNAPTQAPIAVPAAKPAPAATAAAKAPDREVVLAVSRNLANGEQDPYFTHSSLMEGTP